MAIAHATNALLWALPDGERRQFLAQAQRVPLTKGATLYHAGDTLTHAYFPLCGLVALLGTTADGATLQMDVVDSERFAGVPLVLRREETPYEAVVQAPGEAYRIAATALRTACARSEAFQDLLLRFANEHLTHVAEAALCHRHHSVRQRLCRWLLVYARSARSDTVILTQELWAQLLGARRTAVSKAACVLQDQAIIRQRHGRTQILSRAGCTPRLRVCRRRAGG